MLRNVLKGKGEGLMVRDPRAPYEHKRVRTLYKVKPARDTEGTVVGVLEGAGKYKGLLGKLELRLPNGKTVLVGTGFTDQQRRDFFTPNMIGRVVTIQYMTLTDAGIPRQPVFMRIRHDAGI